MRKQGAFLSGPTYVQTRAVGLHSLTNFGTHPSAHLGARLHVPALSSLLSSSFALPSGRVRRRVLQSSLLRPASDRHHYGPLASMRPRPLRSQDIHRCSRGSTLHQEGLGALGSIIGPKGQTHFAQWGFKSGIYLAQAPHTTGVRGSQGHIFGPRTSFVFEQCALRSSWWGQGETMAPCSVAWSNQNKVSMLASGTLEKEKPPNRRGWLRTVRLKTRDIGLKVLRIMYPTLQMIKKYR